MASAVPLTRTLAQARLWEVPTLAKKSLCSQDTTRQLCSSVVVYVHVSSQLAQSSLKSTRVYLHVTSRLRPTEGMCQKLVSRAMQPHSICRHHATHQCLTSTSMLVLCTTRRLQALVECPITRDMLQALNDESSSPSISSLTKRLVTQTLAGIARNAT